MIVSQAPPSMGFSRQESWSGLPFLPPGCLPEPGIKPASPTLQADSLLLSHPGSAIRMRQIVESVFWEFCPFVFLFMCLFALLCYLFPFGTKFDQDCRIWIWNDRKIPSPMFPGPTLACQYRVSYIPQMSYAAPGDQLVRTHWHSWLCPGNKSLFLWLLPLYRLPWRLRQ